jgi:hypothetical protein
MAALLEEFQTLLAKEPGRYPKGLKYLETSTHSLLKAF